ncbi:MAG: hypothetical protein ABSE49_11395 [Polyangiaceae bacterium]|jgi:hypothetical protein
MFRKFVFVGMTLVAGACIVAGCAGPVGGKGEGDSCSGADDCSDDLQCQPIEGRSGDYCCPAPADASSKPNCQAAPDGG